MEKRRLSDWLQAYLNYSEFSEAPELMHFWTGVSTLAGALRRRVWIEMGYFQWTPNFYIIFIAPPGIVSKSTTISIGMNLLHRIPEVHFGPDSVTWQRLAMSMSESLTYCELPFQENLPPGERILLPMSAVTLASSELGTFLDPHNREMIDFLVDLWDSKIGRWSKATKTQGEESVENPWLNIIACTTPAWMKENMPDYVIGGGFASRAVFVYADKKRRLIAYPSLEMPESHHQLGDDLTHDLTSISELIGEYRLTSEARVWGERWYEQHWTINRELLSDERMIGYMSRKQTHLHKLAMVLAASRHSYLQISPEELQLADGFVTTIERGMMHIFEHIGMNIQTRHTNTLLTTIRAAKHISQQKLYRLMFRRMSGEEFKQSLQALVAAGYVTLRQESSDLMVVLVEGK